MILKRFFSSAFVPSHEPFDFRDLIDLQSILNGVSKLLVLTGAGVSTESGIPDYRSDKVGRFATSKHRPIQYQEFIKSSQVRRKYWARNFVAWPKFSSFQPNIVHSTLTYWEQQGRLLWIITQNIDDLHKKAGCTRVTDLHGSAYKVRCMRCDHVEHRQAFQSRMRFLNPYFDYNSTKIAPDGDVDLPDDVIENFVLPGCLRCGGDVKPGIVFFGDNVSSDVVEFCNDKIDTADALLILGTSMSVYSGYRFAKRFSERSKSIFIINIGATRADSLARMKISAKCGDVVPLLKMTHENYTALPLKDGLQIETTY
uniref:Deacetylase sirtuin-type domain-containing protein n=1 Tax=Romanomermis culicivorax TaxID=13658 RepID=A0A915KAH4_ROMCU